MTGVFWSLVSGFALARASWYFLSSVREEPHSLKADSS